MYGEMHLQPQPLFTVSTDGVFMSSVASLWNGRIFLSGADGCFYELAYQVGLFCSDESTEELFALILSTS